MYFIQFLCEYFGSGKPETNKQPLPTTHGHKSIYKMSILVRDQMWPWLECCIYSNPPGSESVLEERQKNDTHSLNSDLTSLLSKPCAGRHHHGSAILSEVRFQRVPAHFPGSHTGSLFFVRSNYVHSSTLLCAGCHAVCWCCGVNEKAISRPAVFAL